MGVGLHSSRRVHRRHRGHRHAALPSLEEVDPRTGAARVAQKSHGGSEEGETHHVF